ncbi:hypothetical protein Glove_109g384 [Diversispora epigaea]|uniref:Uncharacterized protein n=1 Tax=Diversispora epigaea TaxID=1348612 RepID=A0A397JC18_9GLOM|nr:hypothetical protein Glove_109g384 [Diversispora epigaea]
MDDKKNLVWYKSGCGNNIHQVCFDQWKPTNPMIIQAPDLNPYWWYTITIENEILLVPICLGMTIATILNEQKFILRVVQGHSRHSQRPGYCCQAGVLSSNVEKSCKDTPAEVWKKTGILQKFDGFALFGLKNDYTKRILESRELPTCKPTDWTNDNAINMVTHSSEDTPAEVWKKTGILQKFDGFALFGLKNDYTKRILESRELPTCKPTDWTNDNAINSMSSILRAAGCINITPFGIEKSKYEFGQKKSILYMTTLFENGFLQTTSFINSSKLYNNFAQFQMSSQTIKKQEHLHGLMGQVVLLLKTVDPQTKLPVLYLKDNKPALWEIFSETYPDGFKRTTFMTELAQGHFQY